MEKILSYLDKNKWYRQKDITKMVGTSRQYTGVILARAEELKFGKLKKVVKRVERKTKKLGGVLKVTNPVTVYFKKTKDWDERYYRVNLNKLQEKRYKEKNNF